MNPAIAKLAVDLGTKVLVAAGTAAVGIITEVVQKKLKAKEIEVSESLEQSKKDATYIEDAIIEEHENDKKEKKKKEIKKENEDE
jgi:NADPH:quinone reductase-like Zn-dependent oxidoreductase